MSEAPHETVATVADPDQPGLLEKRVLILAPVGRTALLARTALESAGFPCQVCDSTVELCSELGRGAGAAILLEEALSTKDDLRRLGDALTRQPAWSDLPVTIFVAHLERTFLTPASLAQACGGRAVVVLERPIRGPALISLLGASLGARQRQYELRDLLTELGAARARADAANRAKSDFLAMISHELRTPLNAIVGYTSLLGAEISGSLTRKQAEQTERIRRSAAHLTQMIEQILNFSRIEAGKHTVDLHSIDLRRVASDAVALVEPIAAEKNLTLRLVLPEANLVVETDGSKVRQILLNLLGNAIKFTDRGEVELSLARERAGISLRVRDTGSGIAPEHLPKIFEPFEQVDRSLTRRHQGSGLGLGISRRLAHLLGGELSVESTMGVGSVFTLWLPTKSDE
jgi:signal transduction histidine kinase